MIAAKPKLLPNALPRSPVPAGSLRISRTTDEIVEAYLGTCVGVSLRDRKARVGGLIHLLLPEPTSNDVSWQPANNARTGLPLLIEGLCEQGANKERLEACIAGGALVGPISKTDLMMDIGGRTADVTESILRSENIPIYKSEVGGYFSCRLSLNLQDMESTIDPIGIPTSPISGNEFKKPTRQQIENAMDAVLPIPQIALKIIRMVNSDQHSIKDLAKEVLQDQVISAKVIRLCNSAFFHSSIKIDSIDRAILVLGEKRLLQLVLSSSMEDFLSQRDQGYSLCKGGLFKHALGTALASHKIAQLTGKASPDLAYTAGLLHDIGKVVLDQFMYAAYPLFYRTIQEENITLIAAERQLFGVSHTEIGGRLGNRWVLPESLIETIEYHHRPEQATLRRDLTHIVFLADLIMSRFMVGQEFERMNTHSMRYKLERIGLTPDQFPIVLGSISKGIFDVELLTERPAK